MRENYLEIAERRIFEMDIEEMALRAARSGSEADIAENRLVNMKLESERILESWMKTRNLLINLIASEKVELKSITQTFDDRFSTVKKGFSGEAWESIKRHIFHLEESLSDLCDAINFLQEYLHPSEEGEGFSGDLPFESVWGVVAQSTAPADFSTPQEAAMLLVNDILNKHGKEIVQEYNERGLDPRTEVKLSDGSAYYDILFKLGEDEFEGNQVGAEELEKACDSDMFQEYTLLIHEAITELA